MVGMSLLEVCNEVYTRMIYTESNRNSSNLLDVLLASNNWLIKMMSTVCEHVIMFNSQSTK
jgi:hypothetical protein